MAKPQPAWVPDGTEFIPNPKHIAEAKRLGLTDEQIEIGVGAATEEQALIVRKLRDARWKEELRRTWKVPIESMRRYSIADVYLGPRKRQLDEAKVDELVNSIQRMGLLHPITVTDPPEDLPEDVYVSCMLVTGLHRLKAMRRLGYLGVDCFQVDHKYAELTEITENLHRAELTALERDEHIARWIELTEANTAEVSPQPVAKPEGGRPEGGVRDRARKLGIGREDARHAVKVASLSPEAKTAAREAGLDINRSALLEAAKETKPEDQIAALQARAIGAPTPTPSKEVCAAVFEAFTGADKDPLDAAVAAFDALDRPDRDKFLAARGLTPITAAADDDLDESGVPKFLRRAA
jgi:ParB-like chromosome segregation protein Spo0J